MSITNPTLSDKAKEMFAQGLGQENLDAFLAADVKDFAVEVLEINGGNEAVAAALQIGGQLTVEELASRFETAVQGISAEDELAEEAAAVVAAPAPSGLTPAQEAANKKAAETAKAAGTSGTEVNTTAQSPAPVAPAPTPAEPAVADLQAEPAEADAGIEVASGLAEPDWVSQLTATGQMFKATFDKYVSDMRPKRPVQPVDAARNQVVLVRTLCGIINILEGSEFHNVFNYVLQQFVAHREGALREIAIFRAIDENQLSTEQAKLFPRLINFLILAADPATRETGLRQVDLQKTLAGELITEAGRRKVFQYFGK